MHRVCKHFCGYCGVVYFHANGGSTKTFCQFKGQPDERNWLGAIDWWFSFYMLSHSLCFLLDYAFTQIKKEFVKKNSSCTLCPLWFYIRGSNKRPLKFSLRKSSFIVSLICFLLAQSNAFAQVVVSGYVFDISKQNPIQLVSVISTQGRGTVTDSNGHYNLTVFETDSIYFSYLNKPTQKFSVSSMLNPERFNISIHINVAELPNVKVRQRNYKEDSMRNRENYAKIFNFQKPTLGLSNSPNNIAGGAGFDLAQLINVFRFKRNKRLANLQRRLIEEEQDKYIDRRFSKRIVLKLTGLSGNEQDTFMYKYRPTYNFATKTIDIDFYQYIQIASRHFKAHPDMPYAQVRRELQIFFIGFEEKIEE
jgi:hypothetical protein